MTKHHIIQIIRYLIAGAIGFVTNFSLYLLFLHLGFSYVTSSVIGFCIGVGASFLAQKFFAFQNRAAGQTGRQLLMHTVLLGFNLLANTLILIFLVEILNVGRVFAAILTSFIVALWSFFAYKFVVFKDSQEIHV